MSRGIEASRITAPRDGRDIIDNSPLRDADHRESIEGLMTTRDIVTSYLRAVEAHRLDEVAGWLHPDVEVIEHPNKLNPSGKRYDAAAIRAAGERGAKLMAREVYAVTQMIVDGDRAAATIEWTGVLADGREMTAHICSVIELRDGKIWRQQQYDCFA